MNIQSEMVTNQNSQFDFAEKRVSTIGQNNLDTDDQEM